MQKELLDTCYTRNGFLIARNKSDRCQICHQILGKYTPHQLLSATTVSKTCGIYSYFFPLKITNQGLWKGSPYQREFYRRFLMHVPQNILYMSRHYSLLSSRNKKEKITLCKKHPWLQKYISS